MANNPLQQYFRQPKIYIKLPSNGVYNKPGTIQGDATNMPVYGMTAMDEIIAKTPDALFSGESTAKIVQSCCPNIKDPWDLSLLDVDAVLSAIRIATFGSAMSITNKCSKCGTDNSYDINLNKIQDHYKGCTFDNNLVLNDIVVKIQPLNYKQSTELSVKNYQLSRKLNQVDSLPDGDEKQQLTKELFNDLATIQNDFYTASIESVDTGKIVVTERAFIKEWLANCDKVIFDSIKDKIEENKKVWRLPTFPVVCENEKCRHEDQVEIVLDQSNFFVKA